MGYLYRPKLASGRLGRVWHAQYFVNGRRIRESTRTAKRSEADRFLRLREGRAAEGRPVLPRVDRILYDEVAADLRLHYRTSGRRNLQEAELRLRPLDGFFAHRRVAELTTG